MKLPKLGKPFSGEQRMMVQSGLGLLYGFIERDDLPKASHIIDLIHTHGKAEVLRRIKSLVREFED